MNREQALQLIAAINALVPYCPPMVFEKVANSPAMGIIVAVANGQIELLAKPKEVQPPDSAQVN